MAADSDVPARSAETDKLWNETSVDPVELHLGKDSGFTLRAYRMSDTLPGAGNAEETEADEADAAAGETDDDERPDIADNAEDEDAPEPDAADFADEAIEADDEEDALDAEPEEVPVFLTRKGKLLVFREPEALVAYVREQSDHDLAVIEEYGELQERLTVDDIVCDEDDTYELDLVVANLRGGHDAWEPELLIKAAEVGRDLGYALKNTSIIGALSPGSPLDDLDEAFRVVVEGGLRGKLAKRRLRKYDAQQAAIAWRGVIGKINDHVEWRG
ncbi:hypothetical protein K3N28_06535 [Glycomyces sp. TRM65418]|uniref:hypothetical protein n=1 Tax=Glycomyces sp. TRM65418 TaxID=2867006 RepID=UPI001CE6B7F6|nr:hypothetical protein [Glycomyces sp. TRM65418]MCC3762726.1 hypothetical protein [Glycomyces sp. TRM65418]QZD56759.1 hypothetical protein K3N28_06485 [Glycomyces sp. TRM65418]